MATSFDDIQDMFLVVVRDYKLDTLYQSSQTNHTTDFTTYLDGFLIVAIPEFDNCTKDLESANFTSRTFPFDLTLKEKLILSKWMVIKWFDKEIQDVIQFNNFLSNTDFQMYSNANNLKSKSDYSDHMREKVYQDMQNYDLKNIDWEAWGNGVFS